MIALVSLALLGCTLAAPQFTFHQFTPAPVAPFGVSAPIRTLLPPSPSTVIQTPVHHGFPARTFVQDFPAFAPVAPATPAHQVTRVLHPGRIELADESGQFATSYRTGHGGSFSERGYYKPTGDRLDNVLVKEGEFSYTSPEGVPVHIRYIADEHGFRPVGNVIPEAPKPVTPTF